MYFIIYTYVYYSDLMQRLRTILKSNQRAKRWLYLSNPSSINQYESNAKKKKKEKEQ